MPRFSTTDQIQGYVCNNTQQNYLSVAWILGEERPGTRHAFDV